jgi:hypothetical protein
LRELAEGLTIPTGVRLPVKTLGSGKRLFADGTIPAAFKVTESTVTSKGVIIVNYERAGGIRAVLGI